MFNKKWKIKLTSTFEKRPLLTKEDFIIELCNKNYNEVSVELIYDKIYNYLPKSLVKNIYPTDDLIIDYDIDEDDVGDILLEYYNHFNLKFPDTNQQVEFYNEYGEDITVERLIQFVNFCGKTGNRSE